MALTGSQEAARPRMWPALSAWAQIKARLIDAEHQLVQRLAGTVFLIRVVNALLAEFFVARGLRAEYVRALEGGLRRQGSDLEQAAAYSMADFTMARSMAGKSCP